ncbi:hypothetical protein FMEAI12_3080003 [Parafrankia sp. Ea1.12]|nr:hypothetical protein FMEAI12_3080003 [Parafrankia sp. Ea1.12]
MAPEQAGIHDAGVLTRDRLTRDHPSRGRRAGRATDRTTDRTTRVMAGTAG